MAFFAQKKACKAIFSMHNNGVSGVVNKKEASHGIFFKTNDLKRTDISGYLRKLLQP